VVVARGVVKLDGRFNLRSRRIGPTRWFGLGVLSASSAMLRVDDRQTHMPFCDHSY